MPLLKSILMEREAKISDLSKEIRRIQSENLRLLDEKQHFLSENNRLRKQVEVDNKKVPLLEFTFFIKIHIYI